MEAINRVVKEKYLNDRGDKRLESLLVAWTQQFQVDMEDKYITNQLKSLR